ncbi:hypothetical protein CDV36_000108 [Fusarium kuroshium]|uniref:Uncharacterized protein n=1 Tax=Fusarium kuroshium TaxID=2010991 RepID=A0A3M2SRQ0_9HYPO|nr:hypothetical protein CDV36_000108 [Fusarium kuroshium]
MNVLRSFFNVLKANNPPQKMAQTVRATINPSQEFLQRCNPFKDLPNDPDTVNTLREVSYIKIKLQHFLIPTSLPGDDYALCSKLLRSLETRRDLTWLVIDETGVKDTVQAISRRGSPREPIPDEPFELTQRAKALTAHWTALTKLPEHPRKWEAAFRTQDQPPFITEEFKLELDLEQTADLEKTYTEWRTRRDEKATYLKYNTPHPTGYVQATRDQVPVDETWEILPWVIFEGAASPNDGSRRWLPIYTSLLSQNIPFGWRAPDAPPPRQKTKEEKEQWEREYRADNERRERKYALQKKLRKENERRGA